MMITRKDDAASVKKNDTSPSLAHQLFVAVFFARARLLLQADTPFESLLGVCEDTASIGVVSKSPLGI